MPKDARGHGSNAGSHSAGVKATPQLQRRHFEAIAAELKGAADAGSPAHAARVAEMATKLATTNPGFRRDFFVAAATPGGAYNNKTNKSSRPDVIKKAAKFTSRGDKIPEFDGPRQKSGLGSGYWSAKGGR